MGGSKTTVTNTAGEYNMISLPPGVYSVNVTLDGFVPQERSGVRVNLGGATALDITMPLGAFTGEIEVVSENPVVDPTQVNTGQNFDESYLQNAAIGTANRSYQSVLGQAAGVTGGANPNVFGSTSGENAYFIDGFDTTDPVTATFGTNFNFDAIQEIQFQTGGFEAEYGRATGGVVNLVTKSGGNNFSGTLDTRYRDQSFQESGDHFDTADLETSYKRLDATLGGPLMRDRVWFFASYSYIDSQNTPTASPTKRKFLGNYYIGKVTWQVADAWRTVVKFSGDPADIDNANSDQFRIDNSTRFQTQGGDIFTADLNGVLSDSLLWNTLVGIYRSSLDSYPQSGDLETIGVYNYDTGYYSQNYFNQQYSERNRDEIATNLSWFVDDFGGSHEFKFGLEQANLEFTSSNCATGTPGGVACTAGVPGYNFYDVEDGGTQPYFMWRYDFAGEEKNKGTLQTAYAQDAWRPMPNLTIKGGVRYDTVSYDNDAGTEIADMNKVQPRLGIAWDVTGDAKNVVRATWGRFMHPNATTLPSFAKSAQETSYRFYSCSYVWPAFFGVAPEECQQYALDNGLEFFQDPVGHDPVGWVLRSSQIYGSAPNEIAPDLSATYADELILAYERELFDETSLEISYVDKKTKDIFEDTCDGNYTGTPSADANCDYYVMANLSGLARDYEGVILRLETRHWDWMTLLASYTWSKSEGNVEYTQNAGTDFDAFPAHFENRYGYLSDHRQHRVKLNGYFLLPYDFTIGFDAFWSSAFTWEPQASSSQAGETYEGQVLPDIPYGEYFVEPRGSRDGETAYNIDLQVSKGFSFSNVRLELIGTVQNVLSTEYVTGVCQSISIDDNGNEAGTGCGGIGLGNATTWSTPRRYEVGVRLEF